MKKDDSTEKFQKTSQRFSRPRFRLPVKKILIVTVVFLLLSAIALLFVWRQNPGATEEAVRKAFNFMTFQQDPESNSESQDSASKPLSPSEAKAAKQAGRTLDPKISTNAAKAQAAGDTVGAITVYEDAIAINNDKDEKVALYTNKAVLEAVAGDLESAIASARQAESLAGESLLTASLLASLYQQAGKNSDAAKYYRKAASLVVEVEDSSSVGDRQFYLDSAATLEAL
jgi:Flp pilus assembly protein TadD